jgi:hypothetical protein
MEVLVQKYKSSLHIYTDLSFIQLQAESQVGSCRSSLLCTIMYNLDLFRSNRNLHKYKKVLTDHIHFFQVSPTKPQHAEIIKVLPMGEVPSPIALVSVASLSDTLILLKSQGKESGWEFDITSP